MKKNLQIPFFFLFWISRSIANYQKKVVTDTEREFRAVRTAAHL